LRTPLLLLFALLFSCADAPPPAQSADGPREAKVPRATLRELKGDVKVKRAAGDEWIAAADQMELSENDKLRTAQGAAAVVRFANGSQVSLGEDALISIAESRPKPGKDPADVTVFKGRVDAELDEAARQSLSVTTPSAMVRAGRELVFQ
jgi:hypothetical protein